MVLISMKYGKSGLPSCNYNYSNWQEQVYIYSILLDNVYMRALLQEDPRKQRRHGKTDQGNRSDSWAVLDERRRVGGRAQWT